MARPRLIQDEDLLRAARETFLEQGYSAPTASIARRAGVSEGTLFKRFATKEDLFAAAMGITNYGHWRAVLLASSGEGDVQRNLETAALNILAEAHGLIGTMLTVFARGIDPSHNPMLAKLGAAVHTDQQALMTYLRNEMSLGRVRPLDVEVAAAALHGALTAYIQQEMVPSLDAFPELSERPESLLACVMPPSVRGSPPVEPARYVRSLMELFWPGLKP